MIYLNKKGLDETKTVLLTLKTGFLLIPKRSHLTAAGRHNFTRNLNENLVICDLGFMTQRVWLVSLIILIIVGYPVWFNYTQNFVIVCNCNLYNFFILDFCPFPQVEWLLFHTNS